MYAHVHVTCTHPCGWASFHSFTPNDHAVYRSHSTSTLRTGAIFYAFDACTRTIFHTYFIRSWKTYQVFYKNLKNASCEYDRVNGWNSTLQAAWYIRHVRVIWFLWTKRTIWLLILSFTQNIVRACSMFYPYEGYRSVTPLDAARVNRTIFHNHSVHWYYITLERVGIILSTILM